jgi:hypothetical protein
MKASKVIALLVFIVMLLGLLAGFATRSSSSVGLLFVAALLGLIPAQIASNRGRDFFTWWVYGWALWIVAIIHSLCLQATQQPGLATLSVHTMITPPPPQHEVDATIERVLRDWRRCPSCAEVIRSEAKVCYHCHRNIEDTA